MYKAIVLNYSFDIYAVVLVLKFVELVSREICELQRVCLILKSGIEFYRRFISKK